MSIENGHSPEIVDEDEVGPDGLTASEREYAAGMLELPSSQDQSFPEQERRDSKQEIIEIQEMFKAFEANHSLEELSLLTGFKTIEEARANPVREAARLGLIPITEKINALKKETNISKEEYDELNKVYQKLCNAVGTIQNGIFTHEIVRK